MKDWSDERWQAEQPEQEQQYKIIPITGSLILQQRRSQLADLQANQQQVSQQALRDYQYKVGPQDVLNVVVWNHPELSNPMGNFQDIQNMGRLVRADGTIFYPYAGVIQVNGMTVEEIRNILAQRLKPYIESPQVDVRVVGFRSKKVYVSGEVKQPGIVPITDMPLTLIEAINASGGFDERADQGTAILTRNGVRYSINLFDLYNSGRGNMLLQDRDVIYVPNNEANKVFVMGEVKKQTAVYIDKGSLTLADALSQSEGIDLASANTKEIYVIRASSPPQPDVEPSAIEPLIYHLDAHLIPSLMLAGEFQLQPHDVVFVSTTGVVRFNRVMEQILPTIESLWYSDQLLRGR
jgi:polysaccharide export outer membrane protein